MHPKFQSRAVNVALKQRAQLSPAQVNAATQQKEPVRIFRYYSEARGNNIFSVIDRATGKAVGICTGIDEATEFAKRMEATPQAAQRPHRNASFVQLIARRMTTWTFTFTGGMFAFAFFGS